jgi:hypothetical protein
MLPLVARKVLAVRPPLMSQAEQDHWREGARQVSARGLQAMSCLRKVLSALTAAKVESVCWKGPVQSLRLYQDVGLRNFGDLDIFIRPEQLSQAYQVLTDSGFQPERPLSEKGRKLLVHFDSEYPWVQAESWLNLDLQWKIRAQPILIDPCLNGAWGRSLAYPVVDVMTRVWSWPDEVVFLSVHGLKHRWAAWEWVASFTRTLSQGSQEDWRQLKEIARSQGLERTVKLGMAMAQRLLLYRLPSEWSEQISIDASVQALAEDLIKRIHADLLTGMAPSRFEHWRDYVAMADQPWLTWLRSGKWLIRPSIYDLQSYPQASAISLYALRPWRLIRKVAKNLISVFPNRRGANYR